MSSNLLKLFRQPPRWLRMALAGVLLAFTLDVLAHSLHQHEQDTHQHVSGGTDCAYCVAFNGLMDAPAGVSSVFQPASSPVPAPVTGDVCLPLPPETSAQPRAPPAP
jgi:hypothetical protein